MGALNRFHFYPAQVVWELTFSCNFRCIHCGTGAGIPRKDELSTAEALKLIDELRSLGCEEIHMSGGEPLLRKDWPELAAYARKLGIKLNMITNGFILDEKHAGQMKRLGFETICFSLDGMEKTHNYIRQNEKSWRRVLDAMGILKKNEVRFSAISSISNINIGELDRMREILIGSGCPLWRIQVVTHTGRMPGDLVISIDNYSVLIEKILEYQQSDEIVIDVAENIGYYGCKGGKLRAGMPYLGCYAGMRVAGIESNGNIKGCLSMPEDFVEGNIRDKSFTEIWNNPQAFAYNRWFTRETASGACYDCRYLHLCRGGCTTTSVSATGERANNPYCIYQIERKQGIKPHDSKTVKKMLKYFPAK